MEAMGESDSTHPVSNWPGIYTVQAAAALEPPLIISYPCGRRIRVLSLGTAYTRGNLNQNSHSRIRVRRGLALSGSSRAPGAVLRQACRDRIERA
jgi:hypothetical protein